MEGNNGLLINLGQMIATMKSGLFYTIFLAFLLIGGEAFAQKGVWKLAKSGEGVEVYTRSSEGKKTKSFKAQTIVDYSLDDVAKLLDDVSRYKEWQDNCEVSEVVKRIDENEQYGRYTSPTPWPFTDRDVVMRMRKEKQSDGSIKYVLQSAPDAYPRDDDFMRIEDAGGFWLVKPVGPAQTEVVYEFYADPGGNVPNWLVNIFIVQGPYNSFIQMRETLATMD